MVVSDFGVKQNKKIRVTPLLWVILFIFDKGMFMTYLCQILGISDFIIEQTFTVYSRLLLEFVNGPLDVIESTNKIQRPIIPKVCPL